MSIAEPTRPALPRGSATAEEDFENRLLHACALIESAVSRRRMQDRAGVAEVRPDAESVTAATDELARRARRELVAVMSSANAASVIQTINSALSKSRNDGIRVRVLITPSGAGSAQERWLAELPSQSILIRFARSPIQEMVIADAGSALVCASAQAPVQQMVLSQNAAIVNSLYALFNGVWEAAGTAPAQPQPDGCNGLAAEVLDRLRDGCTDEVAARELGISVRTYRRHVAKVMQDVGATSRFQAGVLAHERGLVDAQGHLRVCDPAARPALSEVRG